MTGSFSLRKALAGPWDASHALAVAALFAPAVGLWAPMGMSPLLGVIALFVLVAGRRERVWSAFPRSLFAILALICVWAGLSAFWAVDPARSLFSAGQLAVTAFGGVILVGAALRMDRDGAQRVGTALMAGVLLGLVLFSLGLVSGRRLDALLQSIQSGEFVSYRIIIQMFNRGVTVTALVAVPALAFLWAGRRRRAAGVTGAVTALAMVAAKALATKALLGVGLLALIVFRRPSRGLGLGLGAVLAALVVIIPLGAIALPPPQVSTGWAFLPFSAHHRLTIWGFVIGRILERPVLGWGMDSSRAIPGGDDDEIVHFEIPRGSGNWFDVPERRLPLHPHNAVLQWWLELGGVGALLFAVLLVRLARLAVGRGNSQVMAVCAGTLLVGGCVISAVSFGFWQSWWQSTMWLLAAWTVAVKPLLSPSPMRDE